MKDVCIFVGIFVVLCATHLFVYNRAYDSGVNAVKAELHESEQAQAIALKEANKEILDLQRIIGNNDDECFNRVWPDEIISSVNIVR